MKTLRLFPLLPLLGGIALAACDDTGPTEPSLDDFDNLTVEEALTLEVLADPASTEVALSLATVQTNAAHRRGRAWSAGEDLVAQAENRFRNAEQAYADGELVRAMEQHREARRLVAQAMEGAGGPRALQGQVERLESLPVMVAGDPESFQDPQGFGLQLGELGRQARNAYQKGNRIQAGGMGVLGEQALRKRQRDQNNVLANYPELQVELGATAIELAQGILDDQGANEEQLDLMAVAQELQARAVEALDAGDVRWAAHFAHLAEWWALKAVVLPGGVTDDEAAFIRDLAITLYDEAVVAVGDEPDELQAALLLKATHMLEAGEANLANGTCKGMGAFWQVAVISSYLIPD